MMQKYNQLLIISLSGLILSSCNIGPSSGTIPSMDGKSWAWRGGSDQSGAYGQYGTKGVGSVKNIPGGRYIAVSWVDNNGNFWLFGGTGNAANEVGDLNDLWKYNPHDKEWTWMSGSNAANSHGVYGAKNVTSLDNAPGARLGAVAWKDNDNNLWLFGGFGYAASKKPGALNDLWKYNINTNQWTWVSGSDKTDESGSYGSKNVASVDNIPGARLGSVAYTDNDGNLWLFGGASDILTNNVYGDLWEYSPSQDTWAWKSGESTLNTTGVYGIQGEMASTNQPGARLDSVGFVDKDGNLWLFGGSGFDAYDIHGLLNDMWKYNITDGEWTWMSGNNQRNNTGVYGILNVASPNNVPGAREHRVPVAGVDNSGKFWMFGGDGYGASGKKGILNDLWQYNPNDNEWTWVRGSEQIDGLSVYGKSGVMAVYNTPGARMDSVGFVESGGQLWIFGGDGNGVSSNGYLNDLWKFE